MYIRALSSIVAAAVLLATGCSDNTQEQSPGEVLARDSSLANDLMQADTAASAATTTTASAPRSRLRPAPATIHPESLHRRTLPAAPTRRTASPGSTSGTSASPSAAAILQRIPGAALPAPAPRRVRPSASP
jgi:hypothetical protein